MDEEAKGQEKIVISSADPNTPEAAERRRRFLQQVKDRTTRVAEQTQSRADELLAADGRETLFAQLLERLWTEASWLKTTSQFADGKPLNAQFRWNVIIIGKLMDGMSAWEAKQMKSESGGQRGRPVPNQQETASGIAPMDQFGGVEHGPE